MIDTVRLREQAAAMGVSVTPDTAEKFYLYAARLVETNQRVNLTAITDPEGILVKHFLDSLTLAPLLAERSAAALSLIDVGTGAGFPGVPLALVCPGLKLTLLDALQKRLTFLEGLCRELAVPAALIHARAEEAGRRPALREQFDVATARAVAGLPVLCEYLLPLVKPGGRMVAMKGPDGASELVAAAGALSVLSGRPEPVRRLSLPPAPLPGEERVDRLLLIVDKTAPTPTAYPRPPAKIAKKPL